MKKKVERSYRVVRYVVYRQTVLEPWDHLWTFLGGFLGIGLIGFTQQYILEGYDLIFMIGSFGASSVLVYGAPASPYAQPRNLVLGHLVSAVIGVTVHKLFPDILWLSAALAVSLSIVAMQITKSTHPPGGATALIANIGSEKIKSLSYLYLFFPVLSGVLILLIVALIVNNISARRTYPFKKIKRAHIKV
ncbi:MAG TPA: HPP family protein [Cytophagaceae bacterium]|jgi:CBS-domain-containing membrane protein|nr:HPP family protein [Cytophagaceae bacterium]